MLYGSPHPTVPLGLLGNRSIFNASRGIRVITTTDGAAVMVVGIAPVPKQAVLRFAKDVSSGTATARGTVIPNCEYTLGDGGRLVEQRCVPFARPSF